MQKSDHKELEKSALLGELARPLVHECNNFLHTLFLQMAIMEKHFPEQLQLDWGNIRRDGKKLVHLLREWESHRPHRSGPPGKTDLNQVIQEIVEEWRSEKCGVNLTPMTANEPLWLKGSTVETKRLCSLLLQNGVTGLEAAGEGCNLEIRTGLMEGKVLLQILDVGGVTPLRWLDFDETQSESAGISSLSVAACKSLAKHQHASIRVEKCADDHFALVVAFPPFAS